MRARRISGPLTLHEEAEEDVGRPRRDNVPFVVEALDDSRGDVEAAFRAGQEACDVCCERV